uniref:Uncharacterized protein n=1 Tax=Arundo donax TaxID=35708 RepID=A0A0A8YH77_ARUDO
MCEPTPDEPNKGSRWH